jgi:hypothetical protein
MSGVLLRILIVGIILAAIAYGVRRIWRDWTQNFRDIDKERRQRDLRERQRPDVIELKPDKDGVYRPGGKDEPRS